jgi:hypothetical protein
MYYLGRAKTVQMTVEQLAGRPIVACRILVPKKLGLRAGRVTGALTRARMRAYLRCRQLHPESLSHLSSRVRVRQYRTLVTRLQDQLVARRDKCSPIQVFGRSRGIKLCAFRRSGCALWRNRDFSVASTRFREFSNCATLAKPGRSLGHARSYYFSPR